MGGQAEWKVASDRTATRMIYQDVSRRGNWLNKAQPHACKNLQRGTYRSLPIISPSGPSDKTSGSWQLKISVARNEDIIQTRTESTTQMAPRTGCIDTVEKFVWRWEWYKLDDL